MNSSVKLLTFFAISLIFTALIYKQLGLSGWETHAYLGGSVLWFIIAVILGKVFHLGLIRSLLISLLITGFIMLFVSLGFGIFLILSGFLILFLFLLYKSESE